MSNLDGRWVHPLATFLVRECELCNFIQGAIERILCLDNMSLDQLLVLRLFPPGPAPPIPRVSMSLGFQMERSAVGHNEPIGLAVAARNDTSTNVNMVKIQLQQSVAWRAKRHSAKKETTLASIVVPPGSELGGFQWASGSVNNGRGQSVAPVENTGQNGLQQQIDAGAGTQFQLAVPGSSLPTLETENIKISHSVGVVVDTECCIADPCVCAPLCVVPTAGALVAQPEAMSLAPAQTLPNLPPQAAQPYSAGPYGSASPTDPYPNNSPTSGMTYGSAQTMPYLNNNDAPLGMTYGSAPGGFAPGVQYPTQQAVSCSGVLEMDEYGHAKPAYVPQTTG